MSSRRRSQDGFTLVEVLAAMLVLVLGLGFALDGLHGYVRASLGTQRTSQGTSLAEREIETIRSQKYASIGLTAAVAHAASGAPAGDENPANPDYWVNANGTLRIAASYHDAGATAAADVVSPEPMVTGGTVAHMSTGVAVSGTTATVYRYVTQRTEGSCLLSLPVGCSSIGSKRVTVAVVLDRAPTGGARNGVIKPIYLSTVVSDPSTAPLNLQTLHLDLTRNPLS